MADQAPVVHMGENSPEYVAYRLLQNVAAVERKVFHSSPGERNEIADRKWILDTYAECLYATKGGRNFKSA